MFNPLKLAAQARDMQKKMKEVQKELQRTTVEVKNNAVTVVMNGEQKVVTLTINPVALETGKVDALEKAIREALNEAGEKVQKLAAEQMSKVTSGIQIPGLTM
ncbi:MAG: YbaB/EbfC family nucleoid-associated protein [bacterium]